MFIGALFFSSFFGERPVATRLGALRFWKLLESGYVRVTLSFPNELLWYFVASLPWVPVV